MRRRRRRRRRENEEEDGGNVTKNPRGCKKQGNVKNTFFFLFITLGFPCLSLNVHFRHIPDRPPVTLILISMTTLTIFYKYILLLKKVLHAVTCTT